eukprot:g3681.t1
MSVDKQGWRRSPISPLAHSIRMDAVRQANIYPTCRLDKSSRAVYEPEDVWAKRAALVKPETRSNVGNSWARGMFKQKVLTISTAGVTKANMESIDRVKETVAVLMKNKERATDIGTVERRVLQPQVARKMARMNATKKAEFEKQVQHEVERVVIAAKRRYIRRQAKLDDAGVFHPEANAHRVHTQFWADLNNRVDITKIENEVWAKMHTDAEEQQGGRNGITGSAPGAAAPAPPRRTQAVSAGGAGSRADGDSVRPSSKDSSRPDVASSSKEAVAAASTAAEDEPTQAPSAPAVDEAATPSSASPSKALAGILGYEELGHVPTLEEFRSEWSRLKAQADFAASGASPGDGGAGGGDWKGSRWRQQGQGGGGGGGGGGQAPQQGPGSVVNELSKRDEVFRHFKKYYDKADHSDRRVGDALFPTGVNSTGLLQPDFGVIDAVGRHTAQSQESRCHSRIGEGLLSAPPRGNSNTGAAARRGDRLRQRSWDTPGDADAGGDGFTNVFLESAAELGSEGFNKNSDHGVASPFHSRSRGHDGSRPATGSPGGDGKRGGFEGAFSGSLMSASKPSRGIGGLRGLHSNHPKGGADSGRAKASLEGSSTSAELQARLEASWRALFVPAKLKLDFLQKYCTLERALDLPRTAHLLEIASKAVPLREKVIDHLRRIEEDGEPMSAASVFSTDEEGLLYDLECWENFGTVEERVPEHASQACPEEDAGDSGETGSETEAGEESSPRSDVRGAGNDEGRAEDIKAKAHRRSIVERENRRRTAEAVVVWLRSVESSLAAKCAEVVDAAWYNLGETITYKGRPVAYSIPAPVMEAAAKRRERQEDRDRDRDRRS